MTDNTQRMALPELTAAQQAVFATWNQALTQLDATIDMYVLDISVDTPPASPVDGDTYGIGASPTGDWASNAGQIAYWIGSAWQFFIPFNGQLAFLASTSMLNVYLDGTWTAVGYTDVAGFVTETGTQTLSNKTFSGNLNVYTNGGRVSITSGSAPLSVISALFHVVNQDANTCAIRATSYWNGSTATPYTNNDNSLWEVYNDVASDSGNRSWAGSFANAYNNIPAGVTDSGTRTGIIGWAVSVALPDYTHAGTLEEQCGCYGVAGFQGSGSATTAVINNATGVRGFIYNDSAGATIVNAKAGAFMTTPSTGVVENNIAVYATAANGAVTNYSFYGAAGKMYNAQQVLVGNLATQSSSFVCARNAGNCYEFGHSDPGGYGSNLGATFSSGSPFVAFCAEADASGNTFTTRGKLGTVISNDLSGALVFSRLANASASGQSLTESARFDADGHLLLAATPFLPTKTPSSATASGTTGELCWDGNYLYVCVASNTWKRATLSSW
jgi:hypothetical protein